MVTPSNHQYQTFSLRTRNDTGGKQIVSIDVVDSDTGNCEISARADAEHLDWTL